MDRVSRTLSDSEIDRVFIESSDDIDDSLGPSVCDISETYYFEAMEDSLRGSDEPYSDLGGPPQQVTNPRHTVGVSLTHSQSGRVQLLMLSLIYSNKTDFGPSHSSPMGSSSIHNVLTSFFLMIDFLKVKWPLVKKDLVVF